MHNNRLQTLGKLAASLTHEIKNPLSVIKLNLDYLKMSDEKFDKETNECIDASLEAADMIDKLIYNTLEFSRKYRDDFNYYCMNEIIKKSVSIMKGSANKKNICFNLELTDNLPKVNISETKILQVLVNIISNSIEASKENSDIHIKSYKNDDKLKVDIIDQGIGIIEDKKNDIFNDFYTSKESGTGLGLSVCKSILDEHGALFELKNNEEKGAIFTIEFKV